MFKHTLTMGYLLCGLAAPFFAQADSAIPVSACNSDISLSDADFLKKVAGSPDVAKQIAADLNLCVQNNACASSAVEQCTALMPNRLFLSLYYASANIAPPATNAMNFSVPTSPTSSLAHPEPATASPYTIGTQSDNAADTNTKATNNPPNNSDIHWF